MTDPRHALRDQFLADQNKQKAIHKERAQSGREKDAFRRIAPAFNLHMDAVSSVFNRSEDPVPELKNKFPALSNVFVFTEVLPSIASVLKPAFAKGRLWTFFGKHKTVEIDPVVIFRVKPRAFWVLTATTQITLPVFRACIMVPVKDQAPSVHIMTIEHFTEACNA